MSTETPLSDSARGYLSPESKRRFTIVAGVLGAVFFVAQIALPMIIVLAIMLPTMMSQAVRTTELRQATLWQGEIWYVENVVTMNWRDLEHQTAVPWLRRLGLADLREAKDAARVRPPEEEGRQGGDPGAAAPGRSALADRDRDRELLRARIPHPPRCAAASRPGPRARSSTRASRRSSRAGARRAS